MSESARILQAAIEGARDAAIRANAPRGIRLLPDPAFPGSATTANVPLAFNRIVPIEPAGEYNEGRVTILDRVAFPDPSMPGTTALRIEESQADPVTGPGERPHLLVLERPGGRQDQDRRLGALLHGRRAGGQVGTLSGNPERFVNIGPPGTSGHVRDLGQRGLPGSDVLFVVNGQDDNGNGYIDEGFDGVDNDNDGHVDEARARAGTHQ